MGVTVRNALELEQISGVTFGPRERSELSFKYVLSHPLSASQIVTDVLHGASKRDRVVLREARQKTTIASGRTTKKMR